MSPTSDAPPRAIGPRLDVRIRPIVCADGEALRAFYANLSPDSRYRRFFAASSGLSADQASFFCTPDHDHREGFVAESDAPDGSRVIVGHLCVEPVAAAAAEIAVAVADGCQRRGIGRRLMASAIDWARDRGVRRLVATILEANPAMLGLIRSSELPVSWRPIGCGVMQCSLDVDAHDLAA
jgi:GNAT superfamily N-acetyltransferase